MLAFSLTIPKNGTIVIPKEVRNIISTNNIIINVDADNNISILPLKELKGRLSKYAKFSNIDINQEQDKAWNIYIDEKFNDKS